MSNERRAPRLPRWRLRTVQAVTTTALVVLFAAWTLTTSASYSLVSHMAGMRPVTSVQTNQPEVGLLVDAPVNALSRLAAALHPQGIPASFAVHQAPPASHL